MQHFLSKGAHSPVLTIWFTYHINSLCWNTAATPHSQHHFSFFLYCLFLVKLLCSLQHTGCQCIYTAMQNFLLSCISHGSRKPLCSGLFSLFVMAGRKSIFSNALTVPQMSSHFSPSSYYILKRLDNCPLQSQSDSHHVRSWNCIGTSDKTSLSISGSS